MDRGADLAWCSAFPGEKEFLFPPLTYLKPTGRREEVQTQTDADGFAGTSACVRSHAYSLNGESPMELLPRTRKLCHVPGSRPLA